MVVIIQNDLARHTPRHVDFTGVVYRKINILEEPIEYNFPVPNANFFGVFLERFWLYANNISNKYSTRKHFNMATNLSRSLPLNTRGHDKLSLFRISVEHPFIPFPIHPASAFEIYFFFLCKWK